MPRNASGTYSAPAGNPVVTGTAISSTVHNATVADMAAELTDSLSRSGKGGMLVPLGFADGIVSAPGITLNSETTSGIYRAGAGDVRFAILGVDVWSWVKSGATYLVKVLGTALGVDLIQPKTADTTITVKGNRTDVSTGADVTVDTTVARTAGSLLSVKNNGTDKFVVDYAGMMSVQNGKACGIVDSLLGGVVGAGYGNVTNAAISVTSGQYFVEADFFYNGTNALSYLLTRWSGPTITDYFTIQTKQDTTNADGVQTMYRNTVYADQGSTTATGTAYAWCSLKTIIAVTSTATLQLTCKDGSNNGITIYGGQMRWRRLS